MIMGMKQSRGFTLLELLVAITIIGLLSAVIISSLNSSRAKARDSSRAAQIDEFLKAFELYLQRKWLLS